MILKKEVVLNSVAEFLGVWAVGGKATLSLNTQDGVTTIAFSHPLSGYPEDPLHPPPAPTGPIAVTAGIITKVSATIVHWWWL